ncbi:phage baseplate assembly protein V [Variovorax sp. J22R115]|uniref:phage baseplate assembly protein V n=1 Tax=Variovorax sp. J22R115 TaxID=3053509 RepID=UPI002577F46C|nr:phage baseplate assembly protein V [Variovorax sp. J22R115]MDM0047917.1 phage baseplate assembly protein V [Variovorax sp. J22R115]
MHNDLLRDLLAPDDAQRRFCGVVVGIVTNNRDPDGMHRVKVRFPWLNLDDESHWARVACSMAGNGRGSYFLPEPDDEVLVAFEHGSLEHPYVVGALWNGKDKPPESNGDGKNDNRSITSRSGHIVRLCDSDGDERIEIIDKTGNNHIVIKSSDNSIAIESQGDISIKSSTGKVTIEGIGIEITSNAGVKIQAQSTIDASATAQVNIKGALVNVN